MHRDIEVIHREKDKIDGLVIPAHILAHQTASTAVFVTSLPEHEYIIDPMTWMFQQTKEAWINESSGEVKLSLRKMCECYDSGILSAIEEIDDAESLDPSSLPPVSDLCKCVSAFQLSVIAKESGTSKAAKYLKRYKNTAATTPRALVPPYFGFQRAGDDWYKYSLRCANEMKATVGRFPVAPVVAFVASDLEANGLNRISNDYGEFSTVILWAGELAQASAQEEQIIAVRKLVRALRDRGVSVESLYGGYLLMLMHADGMKAISHGILYTEHKGFGTVPGGGGVPDRYYIPAFHEFRSLSQTDLILHKHRELICTCPVCENILNGNPDNFILFADNPELLRSHFLTVRRSEVNSLVATPVKQQLAELERIYGKYNASISNLPNPDSIVDTTRMKGLDYLRIWARALRPEI
jgi:hypothetical protein